MWLNTREQKGPKYKHETEKHKWRTIYHQIDFACTQFFIRGLLWERFLDDIHCRIRTHIRRNNKSDLMPFASTAPIYLYFLALFSVHFRPSSPKKKFLFALLLLLLYYIIVDNYLPLLSFVFYFSFIWIAYWFRCLIQVQCAMASFQFLPSENTNIYSARQLCMSVAFFARIFHKIFMFIYSRLFIWMAIMCMSECACVCMKCTHFGDTNLL